MAGAEESSIRIPHAASPRRIGRYHICFELASGGMATVYLARLEAAGGFKKLVAVKRIHPHLVGQEGFVEMFLDEARLASRVEHPNVCGVFDFGFGDDSYYIAMEFLVGETVARLLGLVRQIPELSPMPAHAFLVARIIADAALGLHAAHELKGDDGESLNVVHRDVSPQNLMVTYDGVAKVMDFGIATAVDQIHHTRTGTVRGKFAYMSPEQLDGRTIDRRADVWSLGVVFWELLTGKHLFSNVSEAEAVRAVIDAKIPAPSAVRSGIPGEFDEIVRRCLSRAPEERWATTEELAVAIGAVRPKRTTPVTPPALGGWLRDLFPDLYARRLELVDQARQMRDEAAIPRVSRMLSEPGADTRRMAEPPGRSTTRVTPRLGPLIAGALLLGLVTLVVVLLLRRGDPEPQHSARGATSSPPPATATGSAAVPAAIAAEPPPAAPSSAPAREPPPRSTRPVQSAPTPSKTGTVDVATPGGWADVYVGGRAQGRTPLRLTLPEGKQTVVLRPFRTGSAQRHAVKVVPGTLSRLVVAVTPPGLAAPR